MIPRYPEQRSPVRTRVKLAPWFVLAVVVYGYCSDHHVHDPREFVLAVATDLRHTVGQDTKPHKPKRHSPAALTLVLPGSAARLSPERIHAYARAAGFSSSESVTATAVALAESGGRPQAHNPVPPDDSYCLMQINMLGQLGPARRARFHLRSNADLYDPATCMRAAYGISGGGADWTPWTTYTRGTYRQFLARSYQVGGR
jgi:hypothetical protein